MAGSSRLPLALTAAVCALHPALARPAARHRGRWSLPRAALRIPLRGSSLVSLGFSADAKRLIGVERRRALSWDVRTGKELTRFEAPASDEALLAVSPELACAATSSTSSVARVRNAKTGALKLTLTSPSGTPFTGAAFAPGGRLLVLGDEAGNVSGWDLRTGRRRWLSKATIASLGVLPEGPEGLTFTADGRRLVVGRSPNPEERAGEVCACNALCGRAHWRRTDRSSAPVAISPGGRFLATGGEAVRVRDLRTGRPLRTMPQPADREVWWLTFARSGRVLVGSGSRDPGEDEKPEIRGCDVRSGRRLWRMRFQDTGPVAASPDGRLLAATVDDAVRVERLR